MVIAINMMDVVRKNGDTINTNQLAKELGCQVVEISALKGDGVELAAQAAVAAAKGTKTIPMHAFSGPVEHAIAHIEEVAVHNLPEEQQRWYAIKLFERDSKAIEALKLDPSVLEHIEQDIVAAETELDDDSESIITNDRYIYIASIIKSCYKKANAGQLSTSDKIDKVVTNRWLGLPIFVVIMFLVYYISMVTVGSAATEWANDGVFGDGWHLLGIGSSEFADAEEQYGDTDLIIDAFAGEYGNDDITAALDMESEDYTEEGAKAALDALVAATPADANISYDVEDEETLAVETVDNVKKADLEDAVAQYENTEYKEAYGAPDTSTYGAFGAHPKSSSATAWDSLAQRPDLEWYRRPSVGAVRFVPQMLNYVPGLHGYMASYRLRPGSCSGSSAWPGKSFIPFSSAPAAACARYHGLSYPSRTPPYMTIMTTTFALRR